MRWWTALIVLAVLWLVVDVRGGLTGWGWTAFVFLLFAASLWTLIMHHRRARL